MSDIFIYPYIPDILFSTEYTYKSFIDSDSELNVNEDFEIINTIISTPTNNTLSVSSTTTKKLSFLPVVSLNLNFDEPETLFNSKIDELNVIYDSLPFLPETDNGELMWDSMSLGSVVDTSYIKDAQRGLKKLIGLLKKGQSILMLGRSVISVIKQFIAFYQDTTRQILLRMIDEVDRMIKNLKSTGIYFLDMVTYHFNDKASELEAQYYRDAWWGFNDKKKNSSLEPAAGPTLEFVINEIMDVIFQYKTESYNEFIDKICEHFLDPTDVLPTQVKKVIPKEDGKKPVYRDYSRVHKYNPLGFIGSSEGYGLSNLKSGRPDFGEKSYMYVVVLAVAFPDFLDLFRLLYTLFSSGGLFAKLFKGMEKYAKIYEDLVFANIDSPKLKYDIIETDGRTEYPYWLGVTLGNLFGAVFDEIDAFLNMLRNYLKEVELTRTFLDSIDDLLKKIIQDIQTIIEIVETIDRILEFINAILSIPTIGMLTIEQGEDEGGTLGIVEKIRNSQGFFKAARSNAKEIKKIIAEVDKEKQKQDSKDTFEYTKSIVKKAGIKVSTTTTIKEKTVKTIKNEYEFNKLRYDLIRTIFNDFINNNMLNQILILNNILKQIEELENKIELFEQEKININSNETYSEEQKINKIAYVNTLIGQEEEILEQLENDSEELMTYLTNIFDYAIDNINDSDIWPLSNDGAKTKIYNKSQLIIYELNDSLKKSIEAQIDYNNELINYINSGKKSIGDDIKYYDDMMIKLENKAKLIYDPNNSKTLLYKSNADLERNKKGVEYLLEDLANQNDIDDIVSQSEIFDPDKKMCFAGIVFCAGTFSTLGGDNFTSWQNIKDELDATNPDNDVLDFSSSSDRDGMKWLKKLFKGTKKGIEKAGSGGSGGIGIGTGQ